MVEHFTFGWFQLFRIYIWIHLYDSGIPEFLRTMHWHPLEGVQFIWNSPLHDTKIKPQHNQNCIHLRFYCWKTSGKPIPMIIVIRQSCLRQDDIDENFELLILKVGKKNQSNRFNYHSQFKLTDNFANYLGYYPLTIFYNIKWHEHYNLLLECNGHSINCEIWNVTLPL